MGNQKGITVKGINYDVGTNYIPGISSREVWNKDSMQQDIKIIRNELHCNAISIYGTDINRLVECSTIALEEGLTVWIQPRLIDVDQKEMLDYLSKVAMEAEELRKKYEKITLNVGCELSIFASGVVPGINFTQRTEKLSALWWLIPYFNIKLNRLLKRATSVVREYFTGEITYGAGAWEQVNWKVFDIVGINYYMDSTNKDNYIANLRRFHRYNKPVVITEFGCCCFEGAAEAGGGGFQIINWNKPVPQLDGPYERNEYVQAEYIKNSIEIYEQENIYGAFVFTYMEPSNTYSPDPLFDLDMASYGIVTAYPKEMDTSVSKVSLKPKQAFGEIARLYSSN